MKLFQTMVSLLIIFGLAGCASAEPVPAYPQSPEITSETIAAISVSADQTEWFSDRDLAGEYDAASAVSITLEGDGAKISGSGAAASGAAVTISKEGVYLLSGKLDNGQIVIDADKSDKVQLVLNNAQITSQSSAAIYIKKADKVFITLADGTQNTLENGGSYTAIDDNNIDGVIFSKSDLTLNGSGTLTVLAAAGHGIVSKDELTIGNGIYQVTAAEHGLTGKDSVAIAAGTLNITAGGDGIHAKNEEDGTMGNLYIANGDITIESGGDAISATGTIRIENGSYRFTTGGGSKAVAVKAGDSRGGMRGGWLGGNAQIQSTADSVSAKGIKADSTITIAGGTFLLDTADDAVHAGGELLITGGDWNVSTSDDAIHSDKTVLIKDGTFHIPYCYEGVEGQSVTVDGGYFDITSFDDGINAAGGMDSSGGTRTLGGSINAIIINGGTIKIVSDGDSLDSNGSITLNGGKLNLTCNGNGNTAVDCDGSYANNGAEITTNDGSENGGGFGGGRGGMKGGFSNGPGGHQRTEGGFGDRGGKSDFRGKLPEATENSQPVPAEAPATAA